MASADYQEGGNPPVGPSANRITEIECDTPTGTHPYTQAHALEHHEIKRIVEDYARAAKNALEAGEADTAALGILLAEATRSGEPSVAPSLASHSGGQAPK